MGKVNLEDFNKIEIRVGTVSEVLNFPEAAKPAYKLIIDFGEKGIKRSSAQITDLYKPEELLYKQVIAVINFPEKQIANFMSECLILGAVNGEEVDLLQPSFKTKNGLRIL